MDKLRIGVLGPSEIANRRFLPGLQKSARFEFAGVASATPQERGAIDSGSSSIDSSLKKAKKMVSLFGGELYEGYERLLSDDSIDAVYLPLPPSLHEEWGIRAMSAGKHILLEKPFTDSESHTRNVIEHAVECNLAVHENYAFVFHNQMTLVRDLVFHKEIGDIRLVRANFGFPYRGENDFRYHKNRGGGAVLDCGGYPVRVVSFLLGDKVKVQTSALFSSREHDVDVYGSATLSNGNCIAQIGFGMDNDYKCDLEVWGSEACIYANRIFTPTPDMESLVVIRRQQEEKVVSTKRDDQFTGSLEHFYQCIKDRSIRNENYAHVMQQAHLMGALYEKNTQQ